eukprot:4106302-Amphidinium_carterae.2
MAKAHISAFSCCHCIDGSAMRAAGKHWLRSPGTLRYSNPEMTWCSEQGCRCGCCWARIFACKLTQPFGEVWFDCVRLRGEAFTCKDARPAEDGAWIRQSLTSLCLGAAVGDRSWRQNVPPFIVHPIFFIGAALPRQPHEVCGWDRT